MVREIIALRNEKGSYNQRQSVKASGGIIALRNEKGSYNFKPFAKESCLIIALRNEKGSYYNTLLFNNNVFNFIFFLHFFLMLSLPFFI